MGVDPEQGHSGPTDHFDMFVEETSISFIPLRQTSGHENNTALLSKFSNVLEDGRPELGSKLMMLIAAIGIEGLDGVNKKMVIDHTGVFWKNRQSLLQNRVFPRPGEAVENNNHSARNSFMWFALCRKAVPPDGGQIEKPLQ